MNHRPAKMSDFRLLSVLFRYVRFQCAISDNSIQPYRVRTRTFLLYSLESVLNHAIRQFLVGSDILNLLYAALCDILRT